MALPRNIQAQVDAADALLAQTTEAQNAPPEVSLEALAKLPDPSLDTPPVVPQPPAAPAPAEPVPTPSPAPAQTEAWEQKYKTLQGLFNKEVPALQQQVRELAKNSQQTTEQLEALRQAKQAPVEAKKPEVDPRDVESFGSDLVEMVQRVTQSYLDRITQQVVTAMDAMSGRIAQLEREVQGTTQSVAMTAEQAFFDRVTKLVPNWETINANEAFLAWLSEEDPVYGAPRQSALNAAQQSLNADRAAAVFRAFEGPLPTVVTPKVNPLAKQVSPSSVATPAPTQPAEQATLTQKQITDFYGEMARGKYRGREDEAARIELVINQAIAAGRVR